MDEEKGEPQRSRRMKTRARIEPEPVNAVEPDQYLPPLSPVDRGPEIVASSLAPQLGSDSSDLAGGKVDMRRFSVIEQQDIPFLIYAKIRGRKARVWGTIYDEYLNLKVSVNGLGRRQIIRMEGVSRGGMPARAMEDDSYQKPGWLARNFTNRGWKKDAERDRM